ncbi:unnamed protein product [Allacma fusca]|uniref:DUF4806 domain-containing protein n=1 Tax=Allacma fusca TaxID=39272 RepID=A0A8J2NWC8_9HEXA|nr:unnamed protein product [Allacma fusca]
MYKIKRYSDRHKRRLVNFNADLELQNGRIQEPNSGHPQRKIPEKVTINSFDCCVSINSEEFEGYAVENDESVLQLSSEDGESDCENASLDFKDKLAQWSLKHRVTQSALTDLLHLLGSHKCFVSLPRDSRTLLKTPKSSNLDIVTPGQYAHFGLETALRRCLQAAERVPDEISIQIGIDGLPIQKSTNAQLWPILVYVSSLKSCVETVGIYFGKSKPDTANTFLQKLVEELQRILKYGFTWSKTSIKVNFEAFICDAPARAFISGTKNHSGYRSCSKCYAHGVWRKKVVFLEVNARNRNDGLFRSKDDPNHHTGTSIIETLPIDIVRCIPLDYMHLVCLGVMRKLIILWTRGPAASFKISSNQQDQISARLNKYALHFGTDFSRKPRSLKEVDHWKATEFRSFLLYSGPVALKSVIKDDYYNHFLCLHVAITILCCPSKIHCHLQYSRSLLKYFVERFIQLYGEQYSTYNVHSLIHLCDDASNFGVLDSFSAFRFESKLGSIKRLIKNPNFPLQQVHRRLSEEASKIQSPTQSRKQIEWAGIEFSGINSDQYKNIYFGNFEIKCKAGDDFCVLADGSIFRALTVAKNDSDELILVGKKYLSRATLGILITMSNQFLMAMFKKTKEVEVVPKCWITEDDGNKYCYWPNYSKLDKIYDAARAQEIPNRKMWKRLGVRIFYEFNTYDEATAEIPHFLNYSDYETLNASSTIITGAAKTSVLTARESDSESDGSVESIASKFKLGPLAIPEPPNIPKARNDILTGIQPSKLFFNVGEKHLPLNSPKATTSQNFTQVSTVAQNDFDGHDLSDYRSLVQEIKEMKTMCARGFASLKLQQDILISAVEVLSSKSHFDGSCKQADPKINFGFPFKDSVTFLRFEDKIQSDVSFRESAKIFLARAGGSNLVEIVNNIFRKLMSDDVCDNFTLYGTAAKASFSKLETFDLIVDSVRAVSITANATEVEIKNAVMSWLTHSKDRIKSRQKSGRKSTQLAGSEHSSTVGTP